MTPGEKLSMTMSESRASSSAMALAESSAKLSVIERLLVLTCRKRPERSRWGWSPGKGP